MARGTQTWGAGKGCENFKLNDDVTYIVGEYVALRPVLDWCFVSCNVLSTNHNIFSVESNNVTLEQCLELFTEPEVLAPEEAW